MTPNIDVIRRQVLDMEPHLHNVRDLLDALILIAADLNPDHADAIHCLLGLASTECETLWGHYEKLFNLTQEATVSEAA